MTDFKIGDKARTTYGGESLVEITNTEFNQYQVRYLEPNYYNSGDVFRAVGEYGWVNASELVLIEPDPNVTIQTNSDYIVEWDVYGVTKSEVFNRQDVAEAFATGLNVKSMSIKEWESIRVSKITKEATDWKPKSNV